MKCSVFPKYRWVVLSLYILTTIVSCSTYQSISPLLTSVMRELNVSYARAGMLLTIMLIVSGFTILFGSGISHGIGLRGSVILENAFLLAGNLMTFSSSSLGMLILARFIAGLGFGMGGLINSMIVLEWFSEKEHPIVNTCNQFFTQAGFGLALLCSVPLAAYCGSWKYVYLALGILNLISLVLTILFFRNNTAFYHYAEERRFGEHNKKKERASFTKALKRKDVRIITAGLAMVTFSNMAFSAFLPSVLENTKNISVATAGAITSVMPVAALASTILCGVLMGAAGVRKPILITATSLMLAGALMLTLSDAKQLLYAGIVLFGFGWGAQACVLYTVVVELKGAGPTLISGATSAVFGICNIVSFSVSFAFNSLQGYFGAQIGLAITAMPIMIGILMYSLMPETGSGRS